MIEFDITMYYFDWQCTYNFYAPQNGVYHWHIVLDDEEEQNGCFKVKYTATDYPLMFVSEGSREPPPPGVFVLAATRTIISSYIDIHLLAKCNSVSLSMGVQLIGTALHLSTSLLCSNAKVPYRGEDSGTLPCAEVYLPSLAIDYSFTFNKYGLNNTLHNLRARCCFVNLVFQGIAIVLGGFQDVLRYAITNGKICDSYIIYKGIPSHWYCDILCQYI